MAKIKICGLTRMEDIDAVNEYKPDYVGFVFAKSRRRVEAQTARELVRSLDKTIVPVGLFVNETVDVVSDIADKTGIRVVQLHGDETDEYIQTLRRLTDCEIWKAVRVREPVRGLSSAADRYLLDAYVESYGGGGRTFDYGYIAGVDMRCHLLAGGLNTKNISDAIRRIKPYAVDVSSGAETDGVKDRKKIKELIEMVRIVK